MTATIAASDTAGSGVAKVEYRVDQGDWQTGASVPLTGAGAHVVSYRVTDTAGNVTSGQGIVGIDTARPTKVKGLTSKGKKGKLTLKFKISDPQPGCGAATVSKIVVTTASGKKVTTIKGLKSTVRRTPRSSWPCRRS